MTLAFYGGRYSRPPYLKGKIMRDMKYTRTEGRHKRKCVGIVLGVVSISASILLPTPEAMGRDGLVALGILMGAVLMWIFNSLPAGVTGLLAVILLVLLDVVDMGTAFAGFGNHVVYFAVAVFCLTTAMMKSSLSKKITGVMLRWAKADSKKLVLAFMVSAGLLSTVMGNLPVTVMFMGFAYSILWNTGARPGNNNLGKCLMIGIPIASLTGGMATPAGSSFNMMALGLYQELTGNTISFLHWTIICLPIAVVMTPICWFFIVKILKPEPIREDDLVELHEIVKKKKGMETYDKKVLFFFIALPSIWILGNWFPVLNVTLVTIISLAVMLLPGVNMFTWEEFESSVPWNIILMLGSIFCIGNVVAQTGGAAFIAELFIRSGVMNLSPFLVVFLVAAFAYLLHTFFPVGPAILSLFLPPFIAFSAAAGISPVAPAIILAVVTAGNYLLPINPQLVITYNDGYYTTVDLLKSGLVPTVILLLLLTVWVPFITHAIGL